MTTPLPPGRDPATGWQHALAPTPECLPIDTLADPLDAAAAAHVAACARCRTEQEMLLAFEASAPSADEGAAVTWIAQEVRRRQRPAVEAPRRWALPRWAWMAASLAIVAGAATLMWRPGRPIDPGVATTTYRAVRIETLTPAGDVASAPHALRWTPVDGAVRYDVAVSEVDGTELWRGTAATGEVVLPEAVRARLLPAKTVAWQVTAKDGAGRVLAVSDATRFRVRPGA